MLIRRSAHSDASSLEPHSSPQYSASCSMYGIWSAAWVSNRRSSHAARVLASAGAPAMTGTSSAMVRLTALPIAPDELSTCSSAGEMRSSSAIAPSAATIGSSRATCLISASASWSRVIAGCDFHPKACLRKRVLKRQECPRAFGM